MLLAACSQPAAREEPDPAPGSTDRPTGPTGKSSTVPVADPAHAVDPPGEARSDLDIFRMYADRMRFANRSGDPLIGWRTPEEVFDAWAAITEGRPCDYTGLTYDRLRGPSGISWPVNAERPDGTDRLYADAAFPTHTDQCETYGHDLLTGAHYSWHGRGNYVALDPAVLPAHVLRIEAAQPIAEILDARFG